MIDETSSAAWPRRAIPDVPELPGAGSSLAFTRGPVTFLGRAHDALGSEVVRFGYLGRTVYSLLGREATEAFFASPNLDVEGGHVEMFGALLPKRFQVETGEALETLGASRCVVDFGAYLDAVRASSREVMTELGNRGEIDAFELASQLSFRAASRFMLGEAVLSPGFFARWRELFFATRPVRSLGRSQRGVLNPLFWRRQDEVFGEIERLVARLIDAKGPIPEGQERSFLDHALGSVYRDKTSEQIVGHLYTMFLAAYVSPTLTLGWSLADLLRRDPGNRWREGVEVEIASAWARFPFAEALDRAPLARLELLRRCVMETLRLRTSALHVRKVVREPFRFAGFEIPVGALVCCSPTFAHLSPDNFERPLEHDPDRWLGTPELERGVMTRRYMPFNTFAHLRPAERFSYAWLLSSIADLFRQFDMELISSAPGVREGIMPVLGDRDGPSEIVYRRRTLA